MFDIESFTPPLKRKIQQSLRLIQSIPTSPENPVEVAYSGGKDSDVILRLVQESGIHYRAIYKNTTIDPPGTAKHVRDNGVEVLMPERTFFQIIAKNGFPNRFKRFCCGELKEYKVLDKSIIGVRKAESNKRKERYTEPTECRYYKRNHKPENRVEAFYPILEWTDDDVYEFITKLNIQCHPLYYDENGEFQVKRRLGCMCCPMSSEKKRIQAFKEHPNMIKAYLRAGKKFLDSHPDCTPLKRYGNVYKWLFRDIFFKSEADFQEFDNNLFGEDDYKSLLEQNFNIKIQNLYENP